jgi:tetratricopeptide (TPR) repeat protein
MLRSSLHLALVVALSTASLPVLAAPAADADTLFDEGRKDDQQGFYKSAIEKYEAAYKKGKNPLILYSIGLSYKKLYGEEQKPELLKSARSVLKDYLAAIEKDPSLGADPEEVKPVLAEIDAELARIEAKPEPEGPEPPDTPPPAEKTEDPGRKAKLAGIGLMASGGGLIVIGSIVGGIFAVKGGRLRDKLNGEGGLYEQLDDGGCQDEPADDEPDDCAPIHTDIADTRSQGAKANTASIVSLAVVGGLGALLVIGGAVSYVLGKKRTADAGQSARLRVLPTASWNHAGVVFEGRF